MVFPSLCTTLVATDRYGVDNSCLRYLSAESATQRVVRDDTDQLLLQHKALHLVHLPLVHSEVVAPPHILIAVCAKDVAHAVQARHEPLLLLMTVVRVLTARDQEGLAVPPAKVLRHDIISCAQVSAAEAATVAALVAHRRS